MEDRLYTLLTLEAEKNRFYASLKSQFDRKGYLSEKQLFYVNKLNDNTEIIEPIDSEFTNRIVKLNRGRIQLLRKKLDTDIFVFNKITNVYRETNKALLVDLEPIRSVSGRCGRCGLTLTDEISKAVKFGPTCSKLLGMKRSSKVDAETINTFLEKYFSTKRPISKIWISKELLQKENIE